MKHYRHEFEDFDVESGAKLRVIIYVDMTPGFDLDHTLLDTAAERAVEFLVDEGIYEVYPGDYELEQ